MARTERSERPTSGETGQQQQQQPPGGHPRVDQPVSSPPHRIGGAVPSGGDGVPSKSKALPEDLITFAGGKAWEEAGVA